jgi:methyltransferase (TIGR00027 family)
MPRPPSGEAMTDLRQYIAKSGDRIFGDRIGLRRCAASSTVRLMRTDGPSRTALSVAARRLTLPRPSSPTGDPQAEERLTRHLIEGAPAPAGLGRITDWVTARTRFFDAEVVAALAASVPQIVLVGAGYDGRALRFRTPGVKFFELDHPLTQRDKRERLAAVDVPADDVVFAAADFTLDDVGQALEAAGHVATLPTLFVCEGVLRYLTEDVIRSLVQRLAQRAAPESVLAVSITTREPGAETAELRQQREAQEARLAAAGEAVLTVPPRATALEWLSAAGWTVPAEAVEDTGEGRLLVRATR